MQEALACLIPKDPEKHAPTDLRPLTITSLAYRLWGASRIDALLEWQETWLPAGLRGFRREAEAGDVWWTLAARIETCVQKGKALFGMSFDFEKCFDLVPHNILMNLLREMGISERLLVPLQTLLSHTAQ